MSKRLRMSLKMTMMGIVVCSLNDDDDSTNKDDNEVLFEIKLIR